MQHGCCSPVCLVLQWRHLALLARGSDRLPPATHFEAYDTPCPDPLESMQLSFQVLFPLFAQLDLPSANEEDEKAVAAAAAAATASSAKDQSLCSKLMSFICELVETSPSIQQQVVIHGC